MVATTIGGGVLLSPATVFAAADAQADVLPTLAVPQAPPATPAVPADDRPVLLEEVIVTARKREEPLQDVPVSVSAFNADQLDARGIQDVRDLTTAVPGLTVTDLGGYNLIYLRGIGRSEERGWGEGWVSKG